MHSVESACLESAMNFGRDSLDLILERLNAIEDRLSRMETILDAYCRHQIVQEWYSTEQFARLVDKAEYTVREWCRQGRIKAEKRTGGRGTTLEWRIPHAELVRYRNDGLRPLPRPSYGNQ